MSVTNQTPINRYAANGVTTVFPCSFLIVNQADIKVTVDGVVKTITTDYTVSGVGTPSGGNVTFLSAPANGTTVVLKRDMAYVRATDYQDNGDLIANTLNSDHDAPILMIQQIAAENGLSIKAPDADSASLTLELPSAADRAGKFLGFDSSGNVIVSSATNVSSADDLNFIPSGSGASSSTVQDKLREWVDFQNDFGAVNVVGTSNTAAWNAAMAAMNASGVRILRVRCGSYDFDTQPNPITTSGIKIICDPNTYFYRNYVPASAVDGFLDIRATAVHIENLAIIAKLGITGVGIKSEHPADGSYLPDYGVLKNCRVYGSVTAYWSKCLYLNGALRPASPVGIRDWLIDNCRFWDVESGGKHIHFNEAIASSVIGGGFFQGTAPGSGLAHIGGSSGHPSQTICFVDGAWSGSIQVEWTSVAHISGSLATGITIDSNSANVLCVAGGGYSITNNSSSSQCLRGTYTLAGNSSTALNINHNATGSTDSYGTVGNTTILSGVTNSYSAHKTGVNTQGASFTLAQLYHFSASQGTFNGPSVVTNQYGFIANSNLTGAGTNYGFYGNIASGSGRYNFYAAGTAQNYTAGEWGIGVSPDATTQLNLAASTTGKSSVRITHGAAPSSPVNGDMWTTTSGLYVRINGVTKTVTLT